jgi:flagellar hook-associated protein 2
MGSSVTPVSGFSGTSKYSQDLQNAVNRAIAIASLPLQQLQADQNKVNNKLSAAQSLQNVAAGVNIALQALSSATGNTLSTSVSSPSVIQATASANALPGTYTVQVTNAGSSSTAMGTSTLPKVTDPATQNISNSSTFTLTVGTSTFTLPPGVTSLNGLAAAINGSGAGVQATIINVGGPGQPDYRLAVQATSLGAVSLQLNDGSANLLSTLTTGANATYTVNGQPPSGISTNSATVTIAPGLTATLESVGSATIQVSTSTVNISSALSGFVTAYNSAVAELNKSRGQNAGALSGDSIILAVAQSLRQMMNYGASSGSVQSLTDLGITFAKDGTLNFDSTVLNNIPAAKFKDVLSFLGSPSAGGFLQTASNTLNAVVDPINGVITSDINGLNQIASNDAKRMQDEQARLNVLQANLTQRMAAQDALIASLEQQMNFITQLLTTTNANSFGNH